MPYSNKDGFLKGQESLKNFTTEQRRELGRKGGIAKGKKNKQRKAMKETLEIIMAMSLRDGKVDKLESIKSINNVNGKNLTVDQACVVKLVQRVINKGDLNALDRILALLGEKPSEKIDVTEHKPIIIQGEDDLDE